jgi:hypothetical protein
MFRRKPRSLSMNMLHLTKLDTRGYREDEGDAPATAPVSINADSIRCFYPRRAGQTGTRITFKDGGGFAVTETYAEIQAYLETGEHVAGRPQGSA